MRVSRKTRADHRDAIRGAATALFQARGIDRVSVAEVAQAAGLTHGAFYGHYHSKTALAAEACAASLTDAAAAWRARAARARAAGDDPLRAIIEPYLSTRHRDAPGSGCALASLGPELTRDDPALRDALAAGITSLAEVLAAEIARRRPDRDPASTQRAALAALAAMTGGLQIARAFADPPRSQAALDAAIAAALAAAET